MLVVPPGFERWRAGPRLSVLLVLVVLAGGTAGYVLIEGWHPWDALYMTVTTVATVGFREVHPLSWPGEVFTIFLIFMGVSTVLYAFSTVMAQLVEGGLHRRLWERRHQRMLNDLKDHFIVCGYGRIGSIVVEEFRRQKVPFVIIERNHDRLEAALGAGLLAVEADASDENVLRRVRIDTARGLIAAVGSDAENVYAILTARLLRPDLLILGRAETEDAQRRLQKAGADRVVSPYRIGGQHLAQMAVRPAVLDFVQLATSSDNLELAMEQVRIAPDAPLAGRSIVEANLRQKFGVVVVGIKRSDGQMQFNPPPEAVMHPGDQLVVLGRVESLKELEAAAR